MSTVLELESHLLLHANTEPYVQKDATRFGLGTQPTRAAYLICSACPCQDATQYQLAWNNAKGNKHRRMLATTVAMEQTMSAVRDHRLAVPMF